MVSLQVEMISQPLPVFNDFPHLLTGLITAENGLIIINNASNVITLIAKGTYKQLGQTGLYC